MREVSKIMHGVEKIEINVSPSSLIQEKSHNEIDRQ